MINNRINPIEATNRATFKKRKESKQEEFLEKLRCAQSKYNGDNKENQNNKEDKKKRDPTKVKEHMELQSQSKIFKIMSMLESSSLENAIKYMKELKRQEEHIKKIEEMTKDIEEK